MEIRYDEELYKGNLMINGEDQNILDLRRMWRILDNEVAELKNKLAIMTSARDAALELLDMSKEKLAEADYQIQQQRLLNPISFNMLESITGLSEKLTIATEALELLDKISVLAESAKAIITEALSKIKAVKEGI